MKTVLLTIASLLLTGTSFAADAVYQVPEASVELQAPGAFSWTGGYLGIQGGFGSTAGTFNTAGLPSLDSDLDGGIIGAFAGANYQFSNNVVLGIEGDLQYNWNEASFGSGLGDVNAETDWQGAIRGRVGYAFDRALIYAAVGWTAAHGEASIDTGAGIVRDDATFDGYTIGGGVDYTITDDIFARIDYRFNDFGSKTLNFGGTDVDADLSQHTFSVGVGTKF